MPLIYHTEPKSMVFEDRITEITQSKEIKIACPYVSLNKLKLMVQNRKDWKFLSDFHELVGNIQSADQRKEFLSFF